MTRRRLFRQGMATALASALAFGSVPCAMASLPPAAGMRQAKAEDLAPVDAALATGDLAADPGACSCYRLVGGDYGVAAGVPFIFAACAVPCGMLLDVVVLGPGPDPADRPLHVGSAGLDHPPPWPNRGPMFARFGLTFASSGPGQGHDGERGLILRRAPTWAVVGGRRGWARCPRSPGSSGPRPARSLPGSVPPSELLVEERRFQ